MHAVGKHRALTQQLVVVVHVQITFAFREQRFNPFDFLKVLADVGVQVNVRVFCEQFACQGQLLRGAGRGEARGDGVMQTALAVPAFDQLLALGVAGFCGVCQIVRRIAVHHHFARDQAQVQTLRGFKQCVNGLRVHAAKYQCGGGAITQQFFEEHIGHFLRVGFVCELAFARKGVGVEPVEQLFAVRTNHAGLREVDVGVDKTGGDQGVGVFSDGHVSWQGGQ